MSTTNQIPEGLPDWLAPHVDEVAVWEPISGPGRAKCWVTQCDRDAAQLGLCSTHHQAAKRRWSPRPSDATRGRRKKPGVVPAGDSETSTTPNTKNA
ncbi:hypothetical protein [Agromyces sp. NPDC055658]